MRPIKVLLCDDEKGMRLIMRKIIERMDGFDIVGEAVNGREAVALFIQYKPDITFLDVDMPELSGIECARIMADTDPHACLIFATAHEQYMKEAFAVYAFDYLVKPFAVERVTETLERIRRLFRDKEQEVLQSAERHQMGLSKLMLRHKDGISLINMADIIMIQREDRSTVLYTAQERIVTNDGLSDLMDRLDSNLFFRSHKSYIINLSMVYQIYPYGRWTYVAKLKGSAQDALVTSEKFNEMEERFQTLQG